MVNIGVKSDKGQKRANNEDAYLVLPKRNIYVVADGVGGNNAGEVASKTAVDEVADYVKRYPLPDVCTEEDIREYFEACIRTVNKSIFALARKFPENAGMATTMLLCYVASDKLVFVNVGDSRAYILKKQELIQITEDHTYVNSLLKMGIITAKEAKVHDRSHVITRAMGAEEQVSADFYFLDKGVGDRILLCSDGLHGEIEDEEISRLMGSMDMELLAQELVARANKAGGRDNITVLCLEILDGKIEEL